MPSAIEQAEAIAADAWQETHILVEVEMAIPPTREERLFGPDWVAIVIVFAAFDVTALVFYAIFDIARWLLFGL